MILCQCKQVSEKEITNFVKKYPNAGFDDIKAGTKASTGCGRCAFALKTLINKTQKKQAPHLQLRLPFV